MKGWSEKGSERTVRLLILKEIHEKKIGNWEDRVKVIDA